MNKPILLAVMLTALPSAVPAQESKPGSVPPLSRCADAPETPLAAGALPARASTTAEPQRGTVAPGTRVPSQTVTPSSRAMAAVSARDEKTTNNEENTGTHCKQAIDPHSLKDSRGQEIDG
jgi:hypothetical protein